MLKEIIEDPRLAWTPKNLQLPKQILSLPQKSVNEIAAIAWRMNSVPEEAELTAEQIKHYKQSLANPYNLDLPFGDLEAKGLLTSTREVLQTIRKDELDDGPGFAIVDLSQTGLNAEQQTNALIVLTRMLGEEFVPQSSGLLLLKDVTSRGAEYDTNPDARYSDTREGGNPHSENAEGNVTVPYFGLLFRIQAVEGYGGESVIYSSRAVHNELLKRDRSVLERLYQDFHWDSRVSGPEGRITIKKPIFSFDPSRGIQGLECQYLRKYIDDGYTHSGTEMDSITRQALDTMDSLVNEKSPLALIGKAQPGMLVLFNNLAVLHARTTYKDGTNPAENRRASRVWITTPANHHP